MSETFALAWLRAFVVTQLVEVPIYRAGYGAPLGVAFAASLVTHPVVWLGFFGPLGTRVAMPYEARVLLAEAFAVTVEAAMLARVVKRPHALAWALVANASSVLVGLGLRAVFDGF